MSERRISSRQVRKQLSDALAASEREIAGHASRGHIAPRLANEGYAGGYRQALMDVLAIMNGIAPADPWNFFGRKW